MLPSFSFRCHHKDKAVTGLSDVILSLQHRPDMGHLARTPEGPGGYAGLRTGGLWINATLRFLGAGGGHLRPGPQRRLDSAISRFWSMRHA